MPVIAWNFTHQFNNWRYMVTDRPGGGLQSVFQLSGYRRVLLDEMPKFFGPDTVLWYYPDKPASGYVFYAVAVLVVLAAVWPFVKALSKIFQVVGGILVDCRQTMDLGLLVLRVAAIVQSLSVSPVVLR